MRILCCLSSIETADVILSIAGGLWWSRQLRNDRAPAGSKLLDPHTRVMRVISHCDQPATNAHKRGRQHAYSSKSPKAAIGTGHGVIGTS